jgi:hypothetical protein
MVASEFLTLLSCKQQKQITKTLPAIWQKMDDEKHFSNSLTKLKCGLLIS